MIMAFPDALTCDTSGYCCRYRLFAFIRFCSCVGLLMSCQIDFLCKALPTLLAFMRSLTRMDEHVPFPVIISRKAFIT